MTASKLPAFESLLKSRDVEDPVNLWVHRPLAYGLVALVHRSPITPNQITFLALIVGLVAGVNFLVGTPTAMLWGGALLWTSAILDGADGILARAQNKFSDLGRALDGTADAIVGLFTVGAGGYHLWVTQHDPKMMVTLVAATATTLVHVYLYDFYKESYLQMTNPRWSGKPERIAEVEARRERYRAMGAGFATLVANEVYVGLVRAQTRAVAWLDPCASRESLTFKVNAESAELYRKHNRAPMKLWALVSLAPHSYTMSILAMVDRLDVYLWLRLVVVNALFVIALLWQRSASRKTREAWGRADLSPVPAQ